MDLESRGGLRDSKAQTSSMCTLQPLPWAPVLLPVTIFTGVDGLRGSGFSRYENGEGRGYGDNTAPDTASVHSWIQLPTDK